MRRCWWCFCWCGTCIHRGRWTPYTVHCVTQYRQTVGELIFFWTQRVYCIALREYCIDFEYFYYLTLFVFTSGFKCLQCLVSPATSIYPLRTFLKSCLLSIFILLALKASNVHIAVMHAEYCLPIWLSNLFLMRLYHSRRWSLNIQLKRRRKDCFTVLSITTYKFKNNSSTSRKNLGECKCSIWQKAKIRITHLHD